MFEPEADSREEEELLAQGHLHVEQHYSIAVLSLTPAGDQDWFPVFYIEEPAFKIYFWRISLVEDREKAEILHHDADAYFDHVCPTT